jgi:hypothetical protein
MHAVVATAHNALSMGCLHTPDQGSNNTRPSAPSTQVDDATAARNLRPNDCEWVQRLILRDPIAVAQSTEHRVGGAQSNIVRGHLNPLVIRQG